MKKPSTRNIFFNAAVEKAARLAGKPGRLLTLTGKLTTRLARVDWRALKKEDIEARFKTLGRMVRAYATGRYREVPWKAFIIVVAAVVYFLNPLDLIPDFIPGLGLTDDFAVLAWVYQTVSDEVEKFEAWEKSSSKTNMKTALIAGSTGLIGKALVQALLDSGRYGLIKALTRTPLGIEHPKLQPITVDFSKLDEYRDALEADDVFCCLGTTMAKAKTKENFRRVDYDYVVSLAGITASKGAKQFLLVSALGADKESSIFYNRVKGEAEEAVRDLPFRAIHILRPSLLLGPRDESRPGEDAAKVMYRVFGWLIPKKYKAIDSQTVAHAMLRLASREEEGVFVHESREISESIAQKL